MITNLAKATKRAAQGAKYWSYAAWTLPFVALSLIVFEHFIGSETLIQKTMVGITVTFFSFSVYWWWWALNRVVEIITAMKNNEDKFEEILSEIKSTREELKK